MGHYEEYIARRQQAPSAAAPPTSHYEEYMARKKAAATGPDYSEMQSPDEQLLANADETSGGSKVDRMLAGLKSSPEGVEGLLKFLHGNDNVVRHPGTNQLYVSYEPGKMTRFDPAGMDWGDAAQGVAGGVMESLPTIAGAAAGLGVGSIPGAAAGAAAGAALHQGVSSLLPGDDKMGMQDRALDVAASSAMGAAGGALAWGGAKMFEKMLPNNILAKTATMQGRVADAEATKGVGALLDTIASAEAAAEAGSAVSKRHAATLASMTAERKSAGQKAFDALRASDTELALPKTAGTGALDGEKIAATMDVKGKDKNVALDVVKDSAKPGETNQLIRQYGRAAKAGDETGHVVSNALREDLQAAIDKGGAEGDAAQAILDARSQWRTSGDALKAAEKSPIARIASGHSDVTVSKLIRGSPQQIEEAVGAATNADAGEGAALRRAGIQHLLGGEPESKEILSAANGKAHAKIRALLPDDAAKSQWDEIIQTTKQAANRKGETFSMKFFKNLVTTSAAFAMGGSGGIVAKVSGDMAASQISKAIETEAGRGALRTLISPRQSTKNIAAASAIIFGQTAKEGLGDELGGENR